MSKKYIFIILAIVLLITGFVSWFVWRKSSPVVTKPNDVITTGRFEVRTTEGFKEYVNDFRSTSGVERNRYILSKTSNYNITFDGTTQKFNISLIASSPETQFDEKVAVEEDFLSKVKVDEFTACMLDVKFTVQTMINGALSPASNEMFTFCPDEQEYRD